MIGLDMTIGEIVDSYPETKQVFVNNGFASFAKEEVFQQLGMVLKLKTALKSKGLAAEPYLRLLEDRVSEVRAFRKMESTVIENQSAHVNMVSLLPCPLKVPLQRELQNFLDHVREDRGLPLNYFIDAFFNSHVNYDDYLDYAEEADELPDIMMMAGFSFLYKKFVTRFVSQGVYAKAMPRLVHPRLAETGIVDPDGHFSVIAVNTLVMVVDQKRLGNLAMPKSWGDILKPEYKNKVVIRGQGDYFCDIVELNIFQDYGLDGIEKLGNAVKCGLHPSQMVKQLLSSQEAAPIYVMPYFFYKTMKEQDHISVVWPEEGALTYPVSLLIKEEKKEEFNELVEYLTGPKVAQICASAYFPAVHNAAEVHLPPEAKFKWLGWDFIRSHDMEALIEELNDKFLAAFHRKKDIVD